MARCVGYCEPMRCACLLLALSACYSPSAIDACLLTCNATADCPDGLVCSSRLCTTPDRACQTGDDGGVDDTPPGTRVCAGSTALAALGEICFDPAPATVSLEGTIDTDTDPRCIQRTIGQFDVCILPTSTVASPVRFEGARPPILWSSSTLSIISTVDVSSTSAGDIGAAADFTACGAPTAGDGGFDATNSLGAGGAGGTFSGAGGTGGSMNGAPGGTAQPTDLVALRGGCRGFSGGSANLATGSNGHGGGVAYLVAGTEIVIAGIINASGGGGLAAAVREGGSGGGSGGQIALDAPAITIKAGAILLALGGGGATGATASLVGNAGADPTTTSPFSAKLTDGRSGCSAVSAGGSGSLGTGAGPGGIGTTSGGVECAAGGGGGGDGFISVHGTLSPTIEAGSKVFPPAFSSG
jgi:hypothetical protein